MFLNIIFLSFFSIIQTGVVFAFSVMTTRILAPEFYGQIAYNLFWFSLLGALTDFGLENAFLSAKQSEQNKHDTFWTHFFLRAFLASLALPLGLFLFHRQRSFVGLMLAFDFIGQKLSFTPKLACEKRSIIKRLAISEAVIAIASGAVTLTMAQANFQACSIILGNIVKTWANLCLYFYWAGQTTPTLPSFIVARKFLSHFGFHGTFSSIIGLFTYDFIPFLVATFSGLHQAGLYSRSFSLAAFPLTLAGSFSRISTAFYSNNTFNKPLLARALSKITLFKIATILPAQLCLIIFAPQIFSLLFKAKWIECVGIFRILILYSSVRLFYDDTTNVLSVGLGKPKYLTESQSFQTLTILASACLWTIIPTTQGAVVGAVTALLGISAATWWFWRAINRELNIFSRENIQFQKESIAQLAAEIKNQLSRLNFMNTKPKTNENILFVSQFSESSTNYCYADFFVKLANNSQLTTNKFDCKYNYFRLGPKSSDLLPWPLKNICNAITNLKLVYTFFRLKPSVLFLVKGENIWYKTLKFLKMFFKFKLINFYPDSPFSFHNGNSNSNVLNSLALYDRFAIWSKTLAQVLVTSGCKEVFYWPFLCDKNIFKPLENDWQNDIEKKYFHSDVCFVGTWDKKRETFLTHLTTNIKNLHLKVWGEFWLEKVSQNSPLYPYLKGAALSPLQMSKAFCASKIVLNFLKDQNLACHNMRTFEVVSTNAFLLTERSAAHTQELFTEDESVACFASKEELVFKVGKYLEETETRFKIAKAGRERMEKISNDSKSLFQNLVSF